MNNRAYRRIRYLIHKIFNKLNHKNIQKYYKISLSLLSIISLMISMFTLGEMKKEREMACQPHIIVEGMNIETDINSLKEHFEAFTKRRRGEYTDAYIPYKLPVYNVGRGTAKNITMTFDSKSLDYLIDETRKYTRLGIIRDNLGYSPFSSGSIHFSSEISAIFDMYDEQTYQYLRSETSDEYNLLIPDYYIYLLYLIGENVADTGTRINDVMSIDVEYYDLQNVRYENRYVLNAEISVQGEIFNCQFYIQDKKRQ